MAIAVIIICLLVAGLFASWIYFVGRFRSCERRIKYLRQHLRSTVSLCAHEFEFSDEMFKLVCDELGPDIKTEDEVEAFENRIRLLENLCEEI